VTFKVAWDNGASGCGTFDDVFDTFEEAEAWGKEWAEECNVRDFGTPDPDGDCYTWEVIEVDEVADSCCEDFCGLHVDHDGPCKER
jgi:hypothetical protein